MGQLNGKLHIDERAQPFVNLPGQLVRNLIEAFHLISEDFHISLAEINEIFRISIRQCYGCDDGKFAENTRRYFNLFDNEAKQVIDSFELLAALIITSDMDIKDKVKEVIDLCNFDKEGTFTINEVTLSLRSSAIALCKTANLERPDDSSIDFYASLLFPKNKFEDMVQSYSYLTKNIELEDLIDMVISLPEIMLWLELFDDLREADVPISTNHPKISNTDVTEQSSMTNRNSFVENNGEMLEFLGSSKKENRIAVTSFPQVNIELEWIYGRNVQNMCPNNCFYTTDGEIVYPAGATVVKFQATKDGCNSQQFYSRHKHYVSCIALSPHQDQSKGQIIASSEYSIKPVINVWSSQTLCTLQTIKGFHSNGVQTLDFSPNGNLLLSLGIDSNNSVAVYDWKENRILYTTTISSKMVTNCKFLGADTKFGACGDSFFHIWEEEDPVKGYKRKQGLFGKSFKIQPITCMATVSGQIITGARDGRIFVWEGRSCVRALDTLRIKTAIQAMSVSTFNQLYAATVDGLILIYDNQLELQQTYRINSIKGNGSCINALIWGKETLLVGTSSSELLELRSCDGKLLREITKGHSQKDSTRIATNPLNTDEIVSVGDNGVLRILNLKTKSEINTTNLGSPVSCVSYNVKGNGIVVAFDEPNAGVFFVLHNGNLSIKIKARPCNHVLKDCKHSNDGKVAAFASANHFIYIYNAVDYSLIVRASGHTSPVKHIDFGYCHDSDTTVCLRSNSVNQEVMFWNLDGKQVTPISQRNRFFETCTCPMTWELVGAHECDEIDQIEACDRSNKGDIVVVANRKGAMHFFRFPALRGNRIFCEVLAHGGPVGSVKFSMDDKYLLTTGKYDCCTMQWKYNSIENCGVQYLQDSCSNFAMDFGYISSDSCSEQINTKSIPSTARYLDKETVHSRNSWRTSVVPPSDYYISHKMKPPGSFALEWVFGYNGKFRNNVFYLNAHNIIYPVGRNLITFNKIKQKQTIYQEATDVITSIAINLARNVCAFGQGDGSVNIICLKYDTMQTIRVLKGSNEAPISHMKINQKGNLLLSIFDDKFHTLTIHDWELESCPIISLHTSVLPVHDIAFTPFDQICLAGEKSFRFYTIEQGRFLSAELNFNHEMKVSQVHSKKKTSHLRLSSISPLFK